MTMSNQSIFFKEMMAKTKLISKDTIGIDDIKKAIKIINSRIPDYNQLTYFFPTENLRYIKLLAPNEKNSAFTITGSSKSILELINQGYKKIITVDTNPFTKHLLMLNIAAFRCLSSKEYDKFLLNYEHDYFLSKDLFSNIKDGFNGDQASINFWDCVLMNDKNDLLNYFFKPINSDYQHIRYGLPFIKNYYDIKNNIDKVQIEAYTEDALDYLINHPEQKFNYIDITNILIFIYQVKCEKNLNRFIKVLESLKEIYDINLLEGGIFVFDYLFGVDINAVLENKVSKLEEARIIAYTQTFLFLKEHYDLQKMSIDKIINLEEKNNDTLLFTKK